MAFKVLSFLILCNWVYLSSANDFSSRPHILSKGIEDIIPANDNYTIFCQGNKPLKWSVPEVSADSKNKLFTQFLMVEEKPTSPKFKYGLRLFITNMTYSFVGFYNCHFEDANNIYENNDENDRVYLYVDDKEHLSVLDVNNFINIYEIQHKTAIIPCRPTSPAVTVSLYLSDGSAVDLNILGEDDTFVRYNAFYGFITNRTIDIDDTMYKCCYSRDAVEISQYISLEVENPSQCGVYMCVFSRDNQTVDSLINLEFSDIPTSYIYPPAIVDLNKGHTNVGEKLDLKCIASRNDVDITFSWIPPSGKIDKNRMTKKSITTESTLTINHTTLEDNGVYICQIKDHQNHSAIRNISIKIFDKDEHTIFMKEPTDTYYANVRVQESITFTVEIWGHPEPFFYWLNNRKELILEEIGPKYEVSRFKPDKLSNQEFITLKVKNLNLTHDRGHFTLVGNNTYTVKTLDFFLNITDKPSVFMIIDPIYLVGEPGKVKCEAAAYPVAVFEWKYQSCLTCPFETILSKITNMEGSTVSSEVTIIASNNGKVKCIATNSIDSAVDESDYIVTDIPNGLVINGFDDSVVMNNDNDTAIYVIGANIRVSCCASIYKYTNITWLFNGSSIKEDNRFKLHHAHTEFSRNVTLEVMDVNYDDSGLYTCRMSTINPKVGELFRNFSFLVKDPVVPKIIDSNMAGEILEDFPKSVIFRCIVEGIPQPKIDWYKDDVTFNPNSPRIRFENKSQILIFNETEVDDQGIYKCDAVYNNFIDSKEVRLKFKNAPVIMQSWLIYIIVLLLIALLGVMAFLIIRVRKERKLKQEMKLLGLANFEKGAIENINPDLGIDDQAELLPYDKKWEFPIEQLKLGKQLGSGAFGVVLKGEAKHIVDDEPVTTVAVKMVKKNADSTYIRALASELKIMVHLGKHLNVVNLLGACTKNVAKRELLVIVEYCRFGNLQNFLLRHRDHFVDQIDPKTRKVNYLIGQDELMDRTYSVSSNRSNTQYPLLKYAALVFSDAGRSDLPSPNAMGDYRTDNTNTGATEATTVTQGEEGFVTSNNSVQPEWRSNYKGDYKGNVNPICTKDLITWSFQIARGMEYLASRKVLHGDLAARNVLLSDENIVKICDFGLAKSMYKNDNYKKRENCPLPVKWMAIESIRDRVFSTQSDVWSFGIVLWEIFSLGRTPYPGMEADERLYHKLVDGYRLESPSYSPNDIYNIMTDCWATKPTSRPSFTKLTEKIGMLLEDTLRKHYIDLNDPYLAMNTKMLENNNDYLAMLSPPSFEAVSSPVPHYVNGMVGIPQSTEEGYMSMKAIFSPRMTTNDEVFDFSAANRKLQSEFANGQELLPMLNLKDDSDTGTPLTSPNSVSNPSYHLPPIINNETKDDNTIVKSSDNYVNMPQNKTLLKDGKSTLITDKKNFEVMNPIQSDWGSIQT